MVKTNLMSYEEILELWYKINKQSHFVIKGFLIYMILVFTSLVLSLFGVDCFPKKTGWVEIFSSWLITSVWIYTLCRRLWISNIEHKRYREVENQITPELEDIAKACYGKDWHKALRECIEAHLPGDCPLCGAQ